MHKLVIGAGEYLPAPRHLLQTGAFPIRAFTLLQHHHLPTVVLAAELASAPGRHHRLLPGTEEQATLPE